MSDLQTVTLKHLASNARDCRIEWKADFTAMEILLFAPFISPALLLDFLTILPKQDERFSKVKITTALQISDRFKIKLCVKAVWYQLNVFMLNTGSDKLDRLEIEFIPSDAILNIQSMQSLKEEMQTVALGERKAPANAGQNSFESTRAAKNFNNLLTKMSLESRARAETKAKEMLGEIQNDDELRAAFRRLEKVLQAVEGSQAEEEMERLVTLIEAYENKYFPIN